MFRKPGLTFFIIILFGAAGLVIAQTPPDSLLTSYVRESWAKNPDLRSMQETVAAESSRTVMSRAWMNPELRAGLNNVPTSFDTHVDPNTMLEIGVSQQVPFPGKRSAARFAGQARTQAISAGVEALRYEIAGNVAEAYFALAGELAVRKSLERGAELIQQMIDATAIAYSTGTGSQTDVLRAKLELEQWKVRLLKNEADIVRKRAQLAAAIGRHADEPLTDPILSDSLPAIPDFVPSQIADSAKAAPDIHKAELEIKTAKADVARAKLNYWPDVDVMASYGYRGYLKIPGSTDPMTGAIIPPSTMNQDAMISLGLSIPIPLYYTSNQGARIQELRAMERASETDLEGARLKKEQELQNIYAQWRENAACCRLELNTVLPRAEETWRSALTEYRGGKTSFASLSEARMAVVMAEMDTKMHRADAWTAYYRWLSAVGRPMFKDME